MNAKPNPFEILGLPARRDLTDQQVDAAWRDDRGRDPPGPARRRGPGPLHPGLRRVRRAAHPLVPVRGLRRRPGTGLGAGLRQAGQRRPALHRTAALRPRRGAARHPPRRPGRGPGPAAVPDPPRPPAAPGPPRDHRRRAGPAGPEPDPRSARRPRRHPRADHLVRADRPEGPRTPVRKIRTMPPAGPRAPRWTRPAPRAARRSRLGREQGHPVPAGQDKPSTPPAAGQSTRPQSIAGRAPRVVSALTGLVSLTATGCGSGS